MQTYSVGLNSEDLFTTVDAHCDISSDHFGPTNVQKLSIYIFISYFIDNIKETWLIVPSYKNGLQAAT